MSVTGHLEICKFLSGLDSLGLDPERKQILEAAAAIESRRINPNRADQLSLSVFGVLADEYVGLIHETIQLSTCRSLLEERIATNKNLIDEFPKQLVKDRLLELDLEQEIQKTDSEIASLKYSAAKAQLVWQQSLKVLKDKDPGYKPPEKKAAQKWLKKREAFEKIAHELRACESKHKKDSEEADGRLHEALCKQDSLSLRLERIRKKNENPDQKIFNLHEERQELLKQKIALNSAVQDLFDRPIKTICDRDPAKRLQSLIQNFFYHRKFL